ncbi:MAG: Rid family detoxifying hydrolase [Bacteroidales bacterium]|nr:Rid family detoxifying hydrolase [Lentimicrobiaceae bacterium]MDD5693918.1 Rid family detoxifying hydrolase [Bacteroidales bacterium]
MKKSISIRNAPRPLAPYSQAILMDNTLYISGQIGIDPFTGLFAEGGPGDQVRQIMKNILAILTEAGMGFSDIVKVSAFLSDIKYYDDFNKVYATYFDQDPPAREAIAVKGLPKNADVEISCIAVRPAEKETLSMH